MTLDAGLLEDRFDVLSEIDFLRGGRGEFGKIGLGASERERGEEQREKEGREA